MTTVFAILYVVTAILWGIYIGKNRFNLGEPGFFAIAIGIAHAICPPLGMTFEIFKNKD